jgi:hypothetical protein
MQDNSGRNAGALSVYVDNTVEIESTALNSNRAILTAGAIQIFQSNNVTLTKVDIIENVAGTKGGGIYVANANLLTLSDTNVVSNSGDSSGGGCIFLNDSLVIFRGKNRVSNNSAFIGGGIFAQAMELWDIQGTGTLEISGNFAQKGSGLAMSLIKSQNRSKTLHDISFTENKAVLGGTVYWLYDDVMTHPPDGLDSATIAWVRNMAPYGERYATQASVLEAPMIYNVEVYNQFLAPEIVLWLKDYYGATIVSANTTLIASTIVRESIQCSGYPGVLDGAIYTLSDRGVGEFNQLTSLCIPGGNMTVSFTAGITDGNDFGTSLPASAYYPTNVSLFVFRPCVAGEYFSNGNCIVCESGSYLLIYEQSTLVCTPCPVGAEICYSNVIKLKEGYWRHNNMSETILECKFGSKACIGGSNSGDALCAYGYIGPLCAVCDENFYFVSDTSSCEMCSGTSIFTPTFIAVFLCIFFLVVIFCVRYYSKLRAAAKALEVLEQRKNSEKGPHETEQRDNEEYGEDDEKSETVVKTNSFTRKIWEWLKSRIVPLFPKIKIMIATFQIVSSSGSSFNVEFPSAFTKMFQGLKFFNFNALQVLPISCIYRADFVTSMMIATLIPIFATAVLFIAFTVEYAYRAKKIMSTSLGRRRKLLTVLEDGLVFRYFSIFLTLSYFILPSVTTTIFEMFPCQNVDPSDTESTSTYLIADYSISCNSNRYFFGVFWAVTMIILYPIGIPLYYFRLLYLEKESIKDRCGEDGVDDDKRIPQTTRMLQFLYTSYLPKYWYFEVIETMRRLMLTAIISVIATGSSSQIVFSMLLSFGFIKIYTFYEPYSERQVGILAEVGQYQIFFTYFCALITSKSLLGDDMNILVAIFLITVNLGVAGLTLYFEVDNYRKEQTGMCYRKKYRF